MSKLLDFHQLNKPAHLISPVALAYVGDAVFELIIRQYLISLPNHKSQHMHKLATSYVSAKAQHEWLNKWLPHLSETEIDIVKRGRNAKSGTPPKNASVTDYRHATAFECLVGYLYMSSQTERLEQLISIGLDTASHEVTEKEI